MQWVCRMRRGKDHLHAMGVRAWGDEVKDRHLACLAASVTPRLGLRELGPLVVEADLLESFDC